MYTTKLRSVCAWLLLAHVASSCSEQKRLPVPVVRLHYDAGTTQDAGKERDAAKGGEAPGVEVTDSGKVFKAGDDLAVEQVYLLGSRDSKARAPRAIAPISQPANSVVVPSDARQPILSPQGQMLYIGDIVDATTKAVTKRALFQYAGEKDGQTRVPLSTPQCDSTPKPDDNRELPGPGRMRVHPDSGEILYGCVPCVGDPFTPQTIDCAGGTWWDADGKDAIAGRDAWSRGGLLATGYNKLLLLGYTSSPEDLIVYDRTTMKSTSVVLPAGTPKNQNPSINYLVAARGVPEGFRMVVKFRNPASYQRFLVKPDGTTNNEGILSDVPADVSVGTIFNAETTMDVMLLDAEGNLLQSAWTRIDIEKTADVVVKRPVMPELSTVIYTEKKSPWAAGLSTGTWLYGVPTAQVFTGP